MIFMISGASIDVYTHSIDNFLAHAPLYYAAIGIWSSVHLIERMEKIILKNARFSGKGCQSLHA